MTRIVLTTILFAWVWLASSGCAHRSAVADSPRPSYEQMQAETERAFELERRADVVIDYEWLDRIRLSTPGQTAFISATDDTLAAAIAGATPKRELAIVIIGKPVRYAFQGPRLREKVDAIGITGGIELTVPPGTLPLNWDEPNETGSLSAMAAHVGPTWGAYAVQRNTWSCTGCASIAYGPLAASIAYMRAIGCAAGDMIPTWLPIPPPPPRFGPIPDPLIINRNYMNQVIIR